MFWRLKIIQIVGNEQTTFYRTKTRFFIAQKCDF